MNSLFGQSIPWLILEIYLVLIDIQIIGWIQRILKFSELLKDFLRSLMYRTPRIKIGLMLNDGPILNPTRSKSDFRTKRVFMGLDKYRRCQIWLLLTASSLFGHFKITYISKKQNAVMGFEPATSERKVLMVSTTPSGRCVQANLSRV